MLRTNEMNPDGVLIRVNLDFMCVGASFFVPCLDIQLAKRQALDIGRQAGYTFLAKARIEGGMQGIRVWRKL